ncbi:MAG: thiamine ABC transporter ATP-binding protein [Bdellovibrionaceae bacterium]|nr:thiamine ABC transporter ATP-binding protein [Pseudobdellovibrionaceae bacterium]
MSVVKNLKLKRSQFDLEVEELHLPEEQVTALVGPSGSGKSSLIRTLLGLENATGWSWVLKGKEMSMVPTEHRNLGVVFQSLELFPHMTVLENVEFPLKCRGQKDRSFAHELMERLGVSNFRKNLPIELSGGERQRVALARALSFRPDFLFLDEPFSSLDSATKEKSRELLKEVLQDFKISTLLISHDKEDVQSLATTVYSINRGKIPQAKP